MTASRRYLLPLLIAAVLILAAGLWLARSRDTEPSAAVGAKVLPTLPGKLNDVNEVRIVTAGDKPVVTLKRSGTADQKDSWQVGERGGYPADFSKVRELLVKLNELEVIEEKTDQPASYPALGVEDLKSEKATGKRLDLGGIQPPISVIVGKSTYHSSNYVRVAGQARSVLAKPQLFVADDPKVWLNHALLDLKEEDVQEVQVSNVGKTDYRVTRQSRDQNDFTVPNIPKGRKLISASTPSTTASGMTNLSLEDVRPLAKDEDWSHDGRAVYRYFDGMVITYLGRKIEGPKEPQKTPDETPTFGASTDKHWVRFEVSFDEAQYGKYKAAAKPAEAGKPPEPVKSAQDVRAEAQKLNARLKDWVYEIQGYRYDNTFRSLEELLEKVEEKKK